MKSSEEIYNILKEKFPEGILDFVTDVPVDKFINVNPLFIDKVCEFLADGEELQFDSLMNLSGVDDANKKMVKDDDGNTKMEGGTLSVVYHIESTKLKHKLILKVSTDLENPEVPSVAEIWKHANWEEREAYDMFGIVFLNHPDLRRILMPYDWTAGYPLRKDYKNPEFYQGMKVPY